MKNLFLATSMFVLMMAAFMTTAGADEATPATGAPAVQATRDNSATGSVSAGVFKTGTSSEAMS